MWEMIRPGFAIWTFASSEYTCHTLEHESAARVSITPKSALNSTRYHPAGPARAIVEEERRTSRRFTQHTSPLGWPIDLVRFHTSPLHRPAKPGRSEEHTSELQ